MDTAAISAQVSQLISVDTIIIIAAMVVLALVALRLGLSFLIALFIALLLTEPLLAMVAGTPILSSVSAGVSPAYLGIGVFVVLMFLVQRLLPNDFVGGTQLFQALLSAVAVAVGTLAVWVHSPLFSELYTFPPSVAMWFKSEFTLIWILAVLLALGFVRNRVAWM